MSGHRRTQHRWLQICVALLAVLAVAAFIGCRFVGSLFRVKLAAAVHDHLHAELVVGSVFYRPPFTFMARDLRIIRQNPDGELELMRAEALDVTLAGIPKKGAPPVITRAVLYQPAMQIADGRSPLQVEQLQLGVQQNGPTGYRFSVIILDKPAVTGLLSGTFDSSNAVCTVDKVSITGRVAEIASNLPWRDVGRKRVGDTEPHGDISVVGAAIVPFRNLQHSSYQLTVNLDDVSARVPPWRRMIDRGNGQLIVHSGDATAGSTEWLPIEGSLDHLDFSAGTARIRVGGGKVSAYPSAGTWQLAQLVGSIEMGDEMPLELPRSQWFFDKSAFHGKIEFTAGGGGPFHVPAGESPFTAIRHEVLVYPHGLSLKPRIFAGSIENIAGGPIAFRGGVVTLANLTGCYGNDKLLLHSARLTLEDAARHIKLDDLRSRVKFEELAGTVIFQQPGMLYPGAMGKTIAALRPAGSFAIGAGSWYAFSRGPKDHPGEKLKPDYLIHLLGDGGSFAVTRYKIPLTEIQGQATLVPLIVDIPHFAAKSLGGTVWAAGKIVPGKPFQFNGNAEVRDTDLKQLAAVLSLPEPVKSHLSGIANARAKLAGTGNGGGKTFAGELNADGELEILHGDFWSVPAVREVASQVHPSNDLNVGDAAAVFHIANRTITLQNAAVNSPLLGLQGTGTVGFDKSIYLTIVAAPLGDWRDKMRQAKIPVVGDILGAVQQLLNGVQGALLYQFRVTGTLAHPVKSIIPAPVIADPIALLFGQMLRQDRNGQLLSDVKGSGQPAATTAPVQADVKRGAK